nr:Ty3/gypsy retrotransposon protein [Tanacetum cinerariifolium]
MQGPDVVLRIQWLQNLGKVTHDYAHQTLKFILLDTTYSLKDDDSHRMKKISLHQMQAMLEHDDVYEVYVVHHLYIETEVEEMRPKTVGPCLAELEQLFLKFDSLFQVPTTLPPYRSIEHCIHLLPKTKPVNVRPYRYPHYQKEEMEKLVNEILSQGIIRFSQSPFSSPGLLVKKKDGSYRFCVDYWTLNAVTVKDKLPILTADEIFDELGEHQFYVKKTKCVFGAETLEYLGHMISRRGVDMDPKKVIADGFRWGGQEATAFQELKQQLSTTPILSLPDYTQEFVVKADASDYDIKAVLLQHNRPISYFSRKLGPRMRAAATYQKELFAIVEAVYKWCQYLVGRQFKIRTDHKSIKELMQQVIETSIQQKYARKLMGFDFVVEYKPRVANQVSDALSRMYVDGELVKAEFMAISKPIVGLLGNLKSENETLKELQALHQQLDTGSGSDGFRREQGLSIFCNRYYVGMESKLNALLLYEFHDTPSAGHGGMKKMLVTLSALFYWRGMHKSVEDYIKQCTVCQQTKYSTHAVGGLPLSNRFTAILVVVDRFSMYAHFGALPTNFNGHKVAELFMEIVVKNHGITKTIVSDWDSIFVNKPSSYISVAGVLISEPSKPKANFRLLFLKNVCNGAEFSIPSKVTIITRFDNTLHGYFIGKRIAFPTVEYYARYKWEKYGLARIMMNSKGFFFFKFNTSKGLEDALENGTWMIRNIPIILKKWSMNTRLSKEELTRILVWVKFHDVPLHVFSEHGITIIASQLGKPILFDSYTSSMCIESWGRSSFARFLIKINADDVLKESLTMVTISPIVEKPCSMKVTISPIVEKPNDGFQMVANKKKNGKAKSTNGGKFGGQSVKKSVRYEPKAATNVPKTGVPNMVNSSKSGPSHVYPMPKIQPLKAKVPPMSSRRSPNAEKGGNIIVSNSYDALDGESEEEVKNVFGESANLLNSTKTCTSLSTYTVADG